VIILHEFYSSGQPFEILIEKNS